MVCEVTSVCPKQSRMFLAAAGDRFFSRFICEVCGGKAHAGERNRKLLRKLFPRLQSEHWGEGEGEEKQRCTCAPVSIRLRRPFCPAGNLPPPSISHAFQGRAASLSSCNTCLSNKLCVCLREGDYTLCWCLAGLQSVLEGIALAFGGR